MAAGLYEVTFPDGARISESPRFPIEVACLKLGTVVTVVEVKNDKARITKPVRGWCSTAHIMAQTKVRAQGGGAEQKPRAATVPKIEVGDRCVLIDGRVGTVRYAGTTAFAKGNWFGVALDKPEGKHNGMVKGKRYFDCSPQHGVFVRMNKIAKVKSAKKNNTPTITINVQLPTGAATKVQVPANSSVLDFKRKVCQSNGINFTTAKFAYNNAQLTNNSQTLAAAGLRPQRGDAQTVRVTSGGVDGGAQSKLATSGAGAEDKPGRARWYGCWFFEGEESYVDLSLDVGTKRLSGEAVDEDNDNLVINGTVKQDDQGHPKWTFKMTMKGEPTIINVGVLINGRIKGVWKVLDSWGKFEMCPAKNLLNKEQAKKKGAIV